MFSKELIERRNNALIKRREYLRLHPDISKVRLSSSIKASPGRSKQQMADIRRILKKKKKTKESGKTPR